MLKTTLGLSVFQLVNRFYKLASETLRLCTDARHESSGSQRRGPVCPKAVGWGLGQDSAAHAGHSQLKGE